MKYKYSDEIVIISMAKLIRNDMTAEEYMTAVLLYKGERFVLGKYFEAINKNPKDTVAPLMELGLIEEKQSNKKLKNYRQSPLVREFYKFVANNKLREFAYRGLKAAIDEKKKSENREIQTTVN